MIYVLFFSFQIDVLFFENVYIDDALNYTIENFDLVRSKYPNKLIVITEAGWTTSTNNVEIKKHNTNEHFQKIYY